MPANCPGSGEPLAPATKAAAHHTRTAKAALGKTGTAEAAVEETAVVEKPVVTEEEPAVMEKPDARGTSSEDVVRDVRHILYSAIVRRSGTESSQTLRWRGESGANPSLKHVHIGGQAVEPSTWGEGA
jgi:hypothetical protein